MDITNTSFIKEVDAILKNGEYGRMYEYDVYVHVNRESKVYKAVKLESIDIVRDYVNNFSDQIIIKALFTGGVYADHIFPYSDALDVTLVKRPLWGSWATKDTKKENWTEKFTAVLTNKASPTVKQAKEYTSTEVLDQANIISLEFSLISKTAEELNMIICGGVFRAMTTDVAVKTVLTNEACQAGNDQSVIVKGVDMIPASNLQPRDHIVVPHGTKLIDLPNYIQKKCGGIYNADIGYYLQERMWYLYPAYDLTRMDTTDRVITFINIPAGVLPHVEKTFRYNGNQIIALANSDISLDNAVKDVQRNAGNAVNFTSPKEMMHSMYSQGGNKVVFDKNKTNTDQSLPVAEYTNPDNNAMNNNPESVEKNIEAVKEQEADFGEGRMVEEAIGDRGAEDSEGAKQHFEEEKQTNNDETADADSNGMEDLSVSDWGFEE